MPHPVELPIDDNDKLKSHQYRTLLYEMINAEVYRSLIAWFAEKNQKRACAEEESEERASRQPCCEHGGWWRGRRGGTAEKKGTQGEEAQEEGAP